MDAQEQTPAVSIVGESRVVPTTSVRPNPYNYNKMSDRRYRKLLASMRKFGFVEELHTRWIPDEEVWEILGGEHRWLAARELEMEEIPIRDLGEMTDDAAKQLCIIFNELRGKPDEVRLATLLRDINVTVPTDDLMTVMPYSDGEMDMYLHAMDFSFDNLPTSSAKTSEEEKEDLLKLNLKWEGDAADRLMKQLARIHDDPRTAIEVAVRGFVKDGLDDDDTDEVLAEHDSPPARLEFDDEHGTVEVVVGPVDTASVEFTPVELPEEEVPEGHCKWCRVDLENNEDPHGEGKCVPWEGQAECIDCGTTYESLPSKCVECGGGGFVHPGEMD